MVHNINGQSTVPPLRSSLLTAKWSSYAFLKYVCFRMAKKNQKYPENSGWLLSMVLENEYFKKVMKKTMHSIFSSFSTVMSSGFFTIKKVDQVCRVVCHSVLEWKSQYERANTINPTYRFIVFLGLMIEWVHSFPNENELLISINSNLT